MATEAEIRAARKNAEFILDNGEFYTPEQWRWKTLDERLDRIEAMLRALGAPPP